MIYNKNGNLKSKIVNLENIDIVMDKPLLALLALALSGSPILKYWSSTTAGA